MERGREDEKRVYLAKESELVISRSLRNLPAGSFEILQAMIMTVHPEGNSRFFMV